MPAPTLDPATAAQMTPEQIADFNSQVAAPAELPQTVNLDEDAFNKMDEGQVADFAKNFPTGTKINIGKSSAPKHGEQPIDLDPETFKKMTPAQLADFSRQTKFSPYTWAQLHRDQLDDATLEKLGQADVESRKIGATLSDIPWESVKDAVPSLVKGLYQYGKLAVKNAEAPSDSVFGQLLRASKGEPEHVELTPGQVKTRAEQTAATEGAAVGLADLARRTFNKTGRFFHLQKPLNQYTPEDAKELFKNELAIRDQIGEVFAGKGELTTATGGPELKKLLATGVQLNPETIAEASAGDPISFAAFSGGFKIFNAVTGKALGYAATRSAALQTLAKLKAIRGVVSKTAATAAEMPTEANIAAANQAVIDQGIVRAGGTLNPMGVLAGTEKAAATGPLISGLEQAQILGEQAGKMITEAPAVAIGRTIQGFGKAVGAVPALEKRAGNLGIAAELIRGDVPGALGILAAKAVRPVLEKTSGALESLGKTIAERNAPGGTWARAIEDLSKVPGTAIGGAAKAFPMDLGLMKLSAETPEEQRESPFMATALGAAHALLLGGKGFVRGQTLAPRPWAPSNSWGKSYGNFPALDAIHADTMKIAGEGVKQRLGALRDLAGTTGTEVFQFSGEDQLAKFFESQGQSPEDAASLARNNGMIIAKMKDKTGENRQVILLRDPASAPHEVSHSIEDALTQDQQTAYYNELEKAHGTENVLKLAQDEAHAQVSTQPEADEYDLNWKNFLLRKTGDGPAAAAEKAKNNPDLAGKPWDLVLTDDEKTELVKLYALKEIGADAMAAALKHSGAAADTGNPVLKVAARTLGKLMTVLGADPYAGVTEGTRGVEVKPEALSAAEEALQPFLVEARAKKVAEKPSVALPPKETPKGTAPKTPPVTPAERAAAAEGIRAEATIASDNAPPAPGAESPRKILSTMADAAEQGSAVRTRYFGAKGEEISGDPDAKREQRRAEIEGARNLPNSVRRLFDRLGFPYGLERTKNGVVQILDWSPELLASNAFRWAKALSELPANHPVLADLPFELDRSKGEFTENGWRQLFDAAETFSRNQMAGSTGSGKELTVPSELSKEGLFKPEQTGVPDVLDQNAADFINMLYSLRPPKTPQVRGKFTPRNITAQVVSKATTEGLGESERIRTPAKILDKEGNLVKRAPFAEPRYGISEIAETNPLRAKLETALQEAGIALPDTIEVVRRLNLDRIHSVELEPAQPRTAGGNVLTLQAGFQAPEAAETLSPVDKAAVRDKEGNIWTGSWHGEAAMNALQAPGERGDLESGWVMKDGTFLNSEQALKRAQDIKQVGEYNTYHQGYLESDEFSKNRRFQSPEEKNPRANQSVAVRNDDTGEIFTGLTHAQVLADLVKKAVEDGTYKPDMLEHMTDGFVTGEGEFLDRKKALARSVELGQIKELPELAKKFGVLESKEFAGSRRFQTPEQGSKEIQDLAKDYTEKEGIAYKPLPATQIPVQEGLAKRLADFYGSGKHNPDDPAVKASYDALGDETVKQYHAIQDAGYTIEPWRGKGEPYASSADMVKDVRENKHLWFMPTDRSFSGEENNLMLRPSGVDDLSYNDVFRAVHDFFGHAKQGYQFGPKGELNAWNAHSGMYSDEAQGALAAETLAQNSWVNFGEHLRNESGNVPKKGEPGYVAQPERPFAEQKNMLVPENLINEAKGTVRFQGKKKLENSAGEDYLDLVHYSSNSGLKKVDPKFFGKGKATPSDLRGGPKSYFFVKGSDFGQDAAIFENAGLHQHEATVPGSKLYDLRAGKPDDLGWRKTVNREEADDIVKDAGYDGIILDTADGRQVVAMFKPVKVNEGKAEVGGGKKFQAPEQSDFENAETLPEALSKPGWAILTGTQEKIKGEKVPWDDPRNIAANAKLKAELKAKGLNTITVEGKYKGEPQGESFVVLGVTPDEAKTLGKKYLQESVITNKGLLYGDGSATPAVPSKTTVGPEAEKQPFYSVLPNGTAFSIGLDFDTPYKPVGEQQELFGKTASEAQEFARRLKSRIADKKEKFPESAPLGYVKDAEGNFKIDAKTGKPVPEKQDYDFVNSGMAKESGKGLRGDDREAAYVKTAGDAMAKEYQKAVKDPEVAAGAKWYSTLRTRLRKLFGDQSQLMCEILAATSARTPVETNYKFGIDALNKFNAGDYDAQIAKYQEGLDKWDKGDIADYVADTNLSNPKRATFLDWWIKKHDLKPRQSNGKLFAANSKALLRALHGSWEGGKKTRQFSQNMSGADFGSTIDVWAARTLHRISNEGRVDRWRILPEHENAVQDEDFDVAQKVFKYAADKVGVKPDAMQGTLWFREKDLWEKRGWTRGAGAEKSDFSSLIAETEKTPEGKFKLKTPQLELLVEPKKVK